MAILKVVLPSGEKTEWSQFKENSLQLFPFSVVGVLPEL